MLLKCIIVSTLCVQLLLRFYTDQFETLQAFLSWSVDVHMDLILFKTHGHFHILASVSENWHLQVHWLDLVSINLCAKNNQSTGFLMLQELWVFSLSHFAMLMSRKSDIWRFFCPDFAKFIIPPTYEVCGGI